MGRISKYSQDKLASSVVGTPGVDRSGQMLASSLASAVGTQAQVAQNNDQTGAYLQGLGDQAALRLANSAANNFQQVQQAKAAQLRIKNQQQAQIDADMAQHHKLTFGLMAEKKATEIQSTVDSTNYKQAPTQFENYLTDAATKYKKAQGIEPGSNMERDFDNHVLQAKLSGVKEFNSFVLSKGTEFVLDNIKQDTATAIAGVDDTDASLMKAATAITLGIDSRAKGVLLPGAADDLAKKALKGAVEKHLDTMLEKGKTDEVAQFLTTRAGWRDMLTHDERKGYITTLNAVAADKEDKAIQGYADKTLHGSIDMSQKYSTAMQDPKNAASWVNFSTSINKHIRTINQDIETAKQEPNVRIRDKAVKFLMTELDKANSMLGRAASRGDSIEATMRRIENENKRHGRSMEAEQRRQGNEARAMMLGSMKLEAFRAEQNLGEDPVKNQDKLNKVYDAHDRNIEALHKQGVLKDAQYVREKEAIMRDRKQLKNEVARHINAGNKELVSTSKLNTNKALYDLADYISDPNNKSKQKEIKQTIFNKLNEIETAHRAGAFGKGPEAESYYRSKVNDLSALAGKNPDRGGLFGTSLFEKTRPKDLKEAGAKEQADFEAKRRELKFRSESLKTVQKISHSPKQAEIHDSALAKEMEMINATVAKRQAEGKPPSDAWMANARQMAKTRADLAAGAYRGK